MAEASAAATIVVEKATVDDGQAEPENYESLQFEEFRDLSSINEMSSFEHSRVIKQQDRCASLSAGLQCSNFIQDEDSQAVGQQFSKQPQTDEFHQAKPLNEGMHSSSLNKNMKTNLLSDLSISQVENCLSHQGDVEKSYSVQEDNRILISNQQPQEQLPTIKQHSSSYSHINHQLALLGKQQECAIRRFPPSQLPLQEEEKGFCYSCSTSKSLPLFVCFDCCVAQVCGDCTSVLHLHHNLIDTNDVNRLSQVSGEIISEKVKELSGQQQRFSEWQQQTSCKQQELVNYAKEGVLEIRKQLDSLEQLLCVTINAQFSTCQAILGQKQDKIAAIINRMTQFKPTAQDIVKDTLSLLKAAGGFDEVIQINEPTKDVVHSLLDSLQETLRNILKNPLQSFTSTPNEEKAHSKTIEFLQGLVSSHCQRGTISYGQAIERLNSGDVEYFQRQQKRKQHKLTLKSSSEMSRKSGQVFTSYMQADKQAAAITTILRSDSSQSPSRILSKQAAVIATASVTTSNFYRRLNKGKKNSSIGGGEEFFSPPRNKRSSLIGQIMLKGSARTACEVYCKRGGVLQQSNGFGNSLNSSKKNCGTTLGDVTDRSMLQKNFEQRQMLRKEETSLQGSFVHNKGSSGVVASSSIAAATSTLSTAVHTPSESFFGGSTLAGVQRSISLLRRESDGGVGAGVGGNFPGFRSTKSHLSSLHISSSQNSFNLPTHSLVSPNRVKQDNQGSHFELFSNTKATSNIEKQRTANWSANQYEYTPSSEMMKILVRQKQQYNQGKLLFYSTTASTTISHSNS